jgi:hypothetical protein
MTTNGTARNRPLSVDVRSASSASGGSMRGGRSRPGGSARKGSRQLLDTGGVIVPRARQIRAAIRSLSPPSVPSECAERAARSLPACTASAAVGGSTPRSVRLIESGGRRGSAAARLAGSRSAPQRDRTPCLSSCCPSSSQPPRPHVRTTSGRSRRVDRFAQLDVDGVASIGSRKESSLN